MIEFQDVTVRSRKANIQVVFEKHAWNKIHGWCKAAKSEVSGWGLVKPDPEVKGKYIVYDTFLPRQQCSSGYTDIDDDAASKLRFKKFKKGIPLDHWRLWWHTHYNFGTFWSGTDDNTAERLMKGNGDWLISVVINQAGNWLCRYDTMYPTHMTVDDLQIYLAKDSKKQKRKRNFKSDIKKWVRPLGQDAKAKEEAMPESQSEYPMQRVTDDSGYFRYDHTSKLGYREQLDLWYEKNRKPSQGSENDSAPFDAAPGMKWIKEGHIWRQVPLTSDEIKKPDVPEGAVIFGTSGWVIHRASGKIMKLETFKKLSECKCGDSTCKTCLDNIELDKEERMKDIAAKEEEKKQAGQPNLCNECNHALTNTWETCTCNFNCENHCFDRLSAMVGYGG